MKKPRVIVVGGSCGGLKTAEELAKKGADVLLLEKNKNIGYKVCAGGLTKKSLSLARIPDSLLQRKFNKVLVKTPHQDTEMKLKNPFIFTINRADMHQHMAKQTKKAGAEIKTNSKVTAVNKNSVVVNNKEEIKFDYLVGADGSISIVRKSLGLKTTKTLSAFQYIVPKRFKDFEIVFDFEKFGSAYAWIFPYKKTTSIGTGADLSLKGQKFQNPGEIKRNFDKWCKPIFDIKKARFEGWTINYDYKGFKFGNKFLVGDAGGFASGLSGEGMCFAMLSGIDISNKIMNPKYKTVNIDHILKIKKLEEAVLKSFEINKILTKIEFEAIALMFKNKWLSRKAMSKID